jgi:hypothetical protein
MDQISTRYRQFLVCSVILLMVGVTVLSTGTRQPCLRAPSGPWHTYKAGHMAESAQQDSSTAGEAVAPAEIVLAETEAAPPRHRYTPCDEALPATLTLVVHRPHFRSPPLPL